ncbi:hypothetical protein [Streptomyces sp. NPDC048639]|uniref:hypothetical protein n=1 Tax=Streptomyces sp. NPDC048639 TaxID=3365581 RepID=UPI00372296A8
MTTGSGGVHAVVPLNRTAPFDDVRDFAASTARLRADRHPGRLTTAARGRPKGAGPPGRTAEHVRADGRGAVCRTCPAPGAPVAMPVAREETATPNCPRAAGR